MKNNIPKQVKKILDNDNHACYVLITCEKPSKDGHMNVEMTYEGEVDLAAYLINTAQGILDEQFNSEYTDDAQRLP